MRFRSFWARTLTSYKLYPDMWHDMVERTKNCEIGLWNWGSLHVLQWDWHLRWWDNFFFNMTSKYHCKIGFRNVPKKIEEPKKTIHRSMYIITTMLAYSLRHGSILNQYWIEVAWGFSSYPSIYTYRLLKGQAQAKIIKKSVILFWLLNMTIWCKHDHRLELQFFFIFCAAHSPVRLDIQTKFLISNYWQPCQKLEIREFRLYI